MPTSAIATQAAPGGLFRPRAVVRKRRRTMIYTRYSCDHSRPESCGDQERKCREGMARKGIDAGDAIVLNDEAVTGVLDSREQFNKLMEWVAAGEVRLLVVDDQSRFSRGMNTLAFLTELVFKEGRFLSIGEGIDTDQPGWQSMVRMMEFHDGRFQGLDLFDRHSTLVYFWESLLDSYAIDWLDALLDPAEASQRPEQAVVQEMLSRAAAGGWETFPSPGEGQDHRLEDAQLTGSALVWEGRTVVHLQLFPRLASKSTPRRPRIHRHYGQDSGDIVH